MTIDSVHGNRLFKVLGLGWIYVISLFNHTLSEMLTQLISYL